MSDKYIIEINYGDINYNVEELKIINKNIELIIEEPFPGKGDVNKNKFEVSLERINESALVKANADSSINMKYRLLRIERNHQIKYILEDWIGTSSEGDKLDGKRILWGRRIYYEKK